MGVNLILGNAGNTVFFLLNDFAKPKYHCHNLAKKIVLFEIVLVLDVSPNTIISARYLNLIQTTMSLGKVSDITEKILAPFSLFKHLHVYKYLYYPDYLEFILDDFVIVSLKICQMAQKCAGRHNKFSTHIHPSNG